MTRKASKHRCFDPIRKINERTKLSQDRRDSLSLAYHSALEVVVYYGEEQAWHTLECSLMVAGKLADMGVGSQYASVIEMAKQALISTKAKGEWKLNVPAYMKNALFSAISAHDEQITKCTIAQFQDALNETLAEMQVMEV